MDSMIYASVRQVSSTWYYIALTQRRSHEDALNVGMMQAELYLSDLGLVDAAAAPYLEGARKAIAGVMQGRLQN
ncbi:hypothetical protein DAERI_030070 [Deinococcus aerius]|uniref:Uncharacterized protein n=2 Tax=Deinococcus aerius TaxID=200253 RepID=A0A2I9CT48_9DEIO|nr:hypothetical protein DAERI_030070 [Deinococcus aerius]